MKQDRRLVFMFSGQGAQYFHMASELWGRNVTFRRWMTQMDDHVRGVLGESIAERIYDPRKTKADLFARTLYTHPAIFMVQHALAETLRSEGLFPDIVLGASLGELSAAVVAGALDLRAGLDLVIEQARVFEARCRPGGMIAILQAPDVVAELGPLRARLTLAAVNAARHFVLSGDAGSVREAAALLRARQIAHQVLPVSHGFHSPMIDPAAADLRRLASGVSASAPRIPLVSCASGGPLTDLSGDHIWSMVRGPIRFCEALRALEADGAADLLLDVGPAGSLATIARLVLERGSRATALGLLSPFGDDLRQLDRVKHAVASP